MGALRDGLGKNLQQLRRARHLTQEKLADLVKIDPTYLGSVERGEKSVSMDVLERILRALRVDPWEMFCFRLDSTAAVRPERMIANLAAHADDSVRPLVVDVVHSILRWTQGHKK